MTGETSFTASPRAALLACLADILMREPERAKMAMIDCLAVAARIYGADFDRRLESVARRQLAQLRDPGVTADREKSGAGVVPESRLVRGAYPSSPALLPLRREKGVWPGASRHSSPHCKMP